MKKCGIAACLTFFSGFLFTQNAISDEIPLFDDSYDAVPAGTPDSPSVSLQNGEEKAVQEFDIPAAAAMGTTPKIDEKTLKDSQSADKSGSKQKVTKDSDMPRLGRSAAPVTSLTIEPIPDVSFDLPLSGEEGKPKEVQKKFTEKENDEAGLIRRKEALSITEAADKPSLEKRGRNSVQISDLQRHDVSLFKVAGIGFGDDADTVYDELTDLGYTLQKIEKAIPRYRTTYYNDLCRKRGLYVLSDINACILEMAESDDVHYVYRETYTRPESRETVQVYYSAPETDNVVYKIVYENKGDTSLNSSRINLAKKFQRRDDFWDLIFNTYGLPDDNDKKLWGDENTRYMRAFMHGSAYHAYVVMEDKIIQDKDYEAAQTDFKTIKKTTAFTLTGEEPEENDE